jgi:transposase
MRKPKKQKKPLNDLSRSLIPFDPNQTLTAVVELSKKAWLVAGIIPGVERQPLKKLGADENELLKLLERWRAEAEKVGHKITRIAVAFEAGRDGFWLARWQRTRGIEAHVIHAASVAVSREHRRAKTDRLDTEQLKRAFLGWLRGERNHCKMAAIPTFAEEDAKRPHRERETLRKWIGPLRHPLDKIGPIQGFSDACMTTLSARTSLALAAWLLTEGPALGLVVLGQVDDRL